VNNVVLTGFMATGKTAIGREVARRLDAPFVDMDVKIETRAGKAIPRIFSEDGESAFRRIEHELCEELSAQEGLVIATGGGALIDPVNRALMMSSGIVFCLTCDLDELLRRVSSKGAPERPLLKTSDRRDEVERLLAARSEAYSAFPWQIDTTSTTIDVAADRIVALAQAVIRSVRYPGGSYNITIGSRLIEHIGPMLHSSGLPVGSQIAVVSNTTVAPLYAARVIDGLRSDGFSPFLCSLPDGEQHKTLSTVAGLYDQFLEERLDRSGTVLALGGGVTGDVAGFAAATFMRGVRFVQVPTTLLSMVDASVGGKTAVDLPQGKNLIGAFKQPWLVVVDPDVLQTLPAAEIRSGVAETVKHGVIGDSEVFRYLEEYSGQLSDWWGKDAAEWIARAIDVKIGVVQDDPFEGGRRAVLNLGHTTGHALERLSGFSLRHGEAVSIGLCAAARIAVRMSVANSGLVERIEAVLMNWDLPTRCPAFEADAILSSMAHDKKWRGPVLRWVLPHDIGRVEVHEEVSVELVKRVLVDMGAKPTTSLDSANLETGG